MPANITQALLDPIAQRRERSRLHARLAAGWCTAAALGAVLWLVHRWSGWALPFSAGIVLVAAIIGAVTAFIFQHKQRATARDIAREIEQKHPELNALVQSAVEQEPDPDTGELNFLQRRVIDRAAAVLREQDWVRRSLKHLSLARAANQAGALVLLAALLAVADIKPAKSTATTQTARQVVRNLEVLPGDTEIEKGATLVVMAKFPGSGPAEATLITLPAGGATRRLPMNRTLDDPTFGAQVPNVTADLLYRVAHPGGESRDFKATVFEYPRLVRADASLRYPAYTGLEAKTIEDTRRINSVEGTELDYKLSLNKAVASARLWSTNGTELPLTTDPGSSNVLRLATTLVESGRYFLTLVDAAGRSNRIPEDLSIVVVPNKEPQMKFVSPRGDQRFSPLEEVRIQAEVTDDFGLLRHGFAYSLNGGETREVELGGRAPRFEKQTGEHLLMLEALGVKTDDLIAYYLWAEDYGPDGQPRRVEGDIFFGDIRPLDEIYRQGQQGDASSGQQQQQQGGSPSADLLELQKDIISATWNVKRTETASKPSRGYKDNVQVIRESQDEALAKAEEVGGQLRDARMQLHLQQATEAMTRASKELANATKDVSLAPLPGALSAEQQAYQHLLRLQAREFQVARQRGGGGGGGQRNQQQMDQLDLADEDNRYANERTAQSQQTPEQREDLQVLSRLKDLARRQSDLNERLKELQTELLAARTEQEKEELRRELKRLQEQQQQLLSEVDELNQRMSTEQNQSRMAEAQQQLEQTRETMRNASEQLQQEQASSALAAGTRAQRDLESMRDDFRERTSNQFSEQMRELRDEARELARQENELQRQFEALNNDTQKSLSDSPLKNALANSLAEQRDRLTNVLQNVRRVSEEAEIAEPLLSRRLYDTYRDIQASQETRNALPAQLRQIYDSLRNNSTSDLENTYQVSRELVDKGFAPWAQEVEKLAQNRVERLSNDIQKAAESILGDDLQALRAAEREMERLNEQLGRDLAANSPTSQSGQPGEAPSGGQQPGERANQNQPGQEPGTGDGQQPGERQLARAGDQPGASGQSNQPGQQPGQGGQTGEAGQPGSTPGQGQQPGQQPGSGQASSQPGQQPGGQGGQGEGQQPGQGEGQGQGQSSSLAQGQQPGQQGQGSSRQGGQSGGSGGSSYSLARGGGSGGDTGGGARRGEEAPGIFTGEGYVDWADGLRNVEEMIDDPELRQQVSTIRDRAREVRLEARRHDKPPQWELVQAQIQQPMQAVRNRLREELARRQSPDNLIAIDRDPVPSRYSELVRRYYERLGSD
jgi:hypothetical protein